MKLLSLVCVLSLAVPALAQDRPKSDPAELSPARARSLVKTGERAREERREPSARASLAPPAPSSTAQLVVGGADACTAPDFLFGAGTFAFDNTFATTGTQGQAEALCNLLGAGTAIQKDVWFAWTALSTGQARIDTCGLTGVDTKIAVYNGGTCPASPALACSDDACSPAYQSTVTWAATSGQPYLIQIGLYPGNAPPAIAGSGSFSITIATPPTNDNCATTSQLTGTGTFGFNLTAASTGAQGQSQAACDLPGGIGIERDVWFRWTAPTSGVARLSTCGSTLDTKAAVYSGTGCPAGAALACDDDACGSQSTLDWAVTSGFAYTIQLGLSPGAPGGSGTFELAVYAPPANDACASPQAIAGYGTFGFDNIAATTGAAGQSEALCNQQQAGTAIVRDVWYSWTAPANAQVLVDSCSTNVDSKIAVYSGTGCPVGAAIACNDDDCGLQSRVGFTAVASQVYTVQLGLYPGSAPPAIGGQDLFRIYDNTPPMNDACATPLPISGIGPHDFDSTLATTGTQGQTEPLCNVFGSPAIQTDQWYVWAPTGSGTATLTTCGGIGGGASEDTKVAVYLGYGCPTSAAIACNEDDPGCGSPGFESTLSWPIACGEVYTIQVGASPLGPPGLTYGFFSIQESSSACGPGTPFCSGDNSVTPCPCSPVPVPHGAPTRGCPNNLFPAGAKLVASGNPSLSADTLVLLGSSMINASVVYFQGNIQQSAGLGQVFGDGLRCANGGVRRFKTKTNVGNASQYPGAGDNSISMAGAVLAPGQKHYQGWYRSANPTFCTVDTFNLTNGLSVTWVP